jgi:GT2 family glycosyltransferase
VDFLGKCHDVSRWKSEPDNGIADAFNKIVTMSDCDWVLFLNAGDTFSDDEVIEQCYKTLSEQDSSVGVCFGDAILVDPDGKVKDKLSLGSLNFGNASNPICHQSAFVRRDIQMSMPYDGRLKLCMDYDFWYRARKVCRFHHFSRVVSRYRLGGISSSRSWGEHAIISHRMVEWLNTPQSKLGLKDLFRLLGMVLVYRFKKIAESVVGQRFYLMIKTMKSHALART